MILRGITIALYFQYQENAAQRKFSMRMIEEDCFSVDAIWNEDKQDYETWPPTSWDCSRDITGDPK